MKFYELIDTARKLLDENDKAEREYDANPENAEAEKAFDESYKAFWSTYMEAVNYIVEITAGKVDFHQAKKLVTIKLDEMQKKGIATCFIA